MPLNESTLGSFGSLSRALGITTASGNNSAWFTDPVGGSSTNRNGLKTVLFDDAQRGALLDFVDEVLGPPEGRRDGEVRWVPLFHEHDPAVTIHAVVAPRAGAVDLGIGVDFATGDTAPLARIRLHVPLFRLHRGDGQPFPATEPTLPSWLLVGNRGGRVTLTCEAVFTDDAPVPREAFLRGATVRVAVPTHPADDLGFALDLVDLQLPGATAATTRTLAADDLDHLGTDVLDFVVGLVRAQVEALDPDDDVFDRVRGLAGMLGLREVTGLPPFPLADLATRGVRAFVDWVEGVLASTTALPLWLGQVADVFGGTADVAQRAVTLNVGDADVLLGLRVTPGTGGHPVLVPWVRLAYDTRAGAQLAATVDLARVDTGAGSARAVPSLRAEALFGTQAGGPALLTGATAVGGLRLGLGLDDGSVPRFVLTAHGVTVAGHTHDVLDLSSPDAALDAVDSVVDAALLDALRGLGAAGDLLVDLLGVEDLAVADLVRDPLGTLRAHYDALLADAGRAAALWGHLRSLLTGVPDAPVGGLGTEASPWRIEVVDGVALELSRTGHVLRVGLGIDASLPFAGDLVARARASVTLVTADLDAGHVTFASGASGRVTVEPAADDGGGPAVLDVLVGELRFAALGVAVRWTPATGLHVEGVGDGLALHVTDPAVATVVDLHLPALGPDGHVVWAPDWDDVETLLTRLLLLVDSPVVRVPLDLLGWTGGGAHLSLAALLDDAPAALEGWLASLALDCGNLGRALAPVAVLLSGGTLDAPFGRGRPESPYRCPVGGDPGAPGLVAWTVPGCPPPTGLPGPSYAAALDAATDGASLVDALHAATGQLPELADLLEARPRAGEGLDALAARWAGTDGVVGAPDPLTALPAGVTGVVHVGRGYGELVAAGRSGAPWLFAGLADTTRAFVHVGTAADWATSAPSGHGIDATPGAAGTLTPVTATGDGAWFVRVSTPRDAAASRPDHDAVQAQAEQVVAALAGRVDAVVLVGHGAAGAAAVRAARLRPVVSSVVTVGTPWAGVGLAGLQAGLGGDAVQLLRSLAPTHLEPWPDRLLAEQSTPLVRGLAMLEHAAATLSPSDLPSAQGETLRPGLEVRAVFGAVPAESAWAAVRAVAAAGAAEREADLDALPSGPPEQLHVGLDVPVLDLDLGGLTVGAGATLTLLRLDRGTTAPTLTATRAVTVTMVLGVTDGWLVGGPGASQRDVECRWAQVRVHVPLDGSEGSSEVVLHDARCFEVSRRRWVVSADGLDPTTAATAALPEARIVLGQVVSRLLAASPALSDLLGALGLTRLGGLDPSGLDRLLHDPATTVRAAVAAAPNAVAGALRRLLGEVPAPSAPGHSDVTLHAGPVTARFDLATGTVTASATVAPPGLPPVTLGLTAGASGASADLEWGVVDEHLGGVRVVGSAATGTGAALRAELVAPGRAALPPTTLALWPAPDTTGLATLLRAVVPAAALRAAVGGFRETVGHDARLLLDGALEALGLLREDPDSPLPRIDVPVGLFLDPVAWLTARVDPFAAAVAVLDALAPLVAPDRGSTPGWPVADGVTVTYGVVAGRLELRAAVDLATTLGSGPTASQVAVGIAGGLSVGRAGDVAPALDVQGAVDGGTGLRLRATPSVALDLLRAAPAAPIPLYPSGPGVGDVVLAGAESLLPRLVDELIGHRTDGGSSLVKDVATVVHDVLDALGLLTSAHRLDITAVRTFAASPTASVLDRLPTLVPQALGSLAHALDPTGAVVSVVDGSTTAVKTFVVGDGGVRVTLDGAARTVTVGGGFTVGPTAHPTGRLTLNALTIGPGGVQVDVMAGPFAIDVGTFMLRPVVVARAGVTSSGFDRVIGVGVSVDELGHDTVEFRWTLDEHPPAFTAVTRTVTAGVTSEVPSTDPVQVGTRLLGVALTVASGILADKLGTVVSDRATGLLQGVVLTGGDLTIDPTLLGDLVSGPAVLARLQRLAFNCATATEPLGVSIGGMVTVALVGPDIGGGVHRLGVQVTLVGDRFEIASGDVGVDLVVNNSWINPHVDKGLVINLFEGTATHLDLRPGFSIGGIGVRFTKPTGPLLELGAIALDGIEVDLYAEANSTGVGGGARLKLDGLAVAPGGGGGSNGVANAMMNDAGSASQNNRPAFSPSVALQKHPGTSPLGFSLTAGDPPGPWWISVQRQLGPLYVERVGFNSVEQGGRVVKISLLFTGQVSLFGLTAAVDQLSINWNGGDVLVLNSWSVDLAGLAVSADMAGLSLAGGLLKTESDGAVSYVGMLVGRFAAYGLSVFGGYTNDHGNASFFVFGAVNGPIGGPPAFFLTGLGGGLGINRGLKVPDDISRFGEYPFIQALDPAARPPANPMDELRRLSEYFPHQMGNFWFAAGISFTCFSLVDGVAVVAVSFGDGLEINLLGLARMALPRPGAAIVSIELALLARFSTREGVFMIKAQLTDNSWLLYEDVRLTGGFAFAIWWKGPLAGQFVLTMGGYHPDFHRDGYPDVPRLGIHWQVSDAIVVKGGSYFALTSEALMAGTDVEASADFGWAWAKVGFGAHGIVYFDPFWFEVRAYARISAGIDIDLGWFGSISISLTLGAQIKVWGPDFAGEATFEVGPCEITVGFGSPRRIEPAVLAWGQFVTKYLEDSGAGSARALSGLTGRGTLPTATGGATGAPTADGSAALPFRVFAEFEITFTTTVPATRVTFGAASVTPGIVRSDGAATALGLSPMVASGLGSTLAVTLQLLDPSTRAWGPPRPEAVPRLTANLVTPTSPTGSAVGTGSFPLGVWGPPLPLGLPVKPVPSGDVVSAGNSLRVVAVASMPAVGPQIVYRQVESKRRPLPLQATGTARSAFLKVAADLPLVPSPTTVKGSFALASATLFPTAPIVPAEGALPVGPQSNLARTTFTRDRSAPPLFGTLTDGLAKANGADGGREELGLPTGPVGRLPRRPEVIAHLTAGAGAVVRDAVTTVSQRPLARRPAPTVESVRGRLGLHLPVVLTRSAPPAVAGAGTVLAVGAVTRTDVAGAVRSYAGSRLGSPGLQELVGGLGARAGLVPGSDRDRSLARSTARRRTVRRDPLVRDVVPRVRDADGATPLRSGDLVVLECADAAIDVAADRRPTLAVTGKARVTLVAGRAVVHDDDALDTEVAVPPGVTHVGVQADGDADAAGGLAGWHDRSRLARIGTHVGLAAGCVVSVDAAGGADQLGWTSAGALVADADEVTTRFSRPVTTVAIALTGADPRTLEPTELHLVGADVRRDGNGVERPPTVVTLGVVTVLVHEVVPDRDATSVSVSVRLGADWTLAGVVGGTEPAARLADRIARGGLAAATTAVLAVSGPGCSVAWHDATAPVRSRTQRRGGAR